MLKEHPTKVAFEMGKNFPIKVLNIIGDFQGTFLQIMEVKNTGSQETFEFNNDIVSNVKNWLIELYSNNIELYTQKIESMKSFLESLPLEKT